MFEINVTVPGNDYAFTIEQVARGYELRVADEDGDMCRLGVYATIEEAFARAGRESVR